MKHPFSKVDIPVASGDEPRSNSAKNATPGPLRLVIAGGGTGGHVFPGIAIAEAVSSLGPVSIMWIGTGRPVERRALEHRGWDYRRLSVKPLQGVGPLDLCLSLLHMPVPVARAVSWLRSFRPDVVLGLGGYVSGPVLAAARIMGIATVLHEQNMYPGLANRLASRFARKTCVSFKATADLLPWARTVVTGNPVRKEIIDSISLDTRAGRKEKRHILVMGGSQGAKGINRLVASALVSLWQSGARVEIMHQSGPQDQEQVRALYGKAGLDATVIPFIFDMAKAYSWADLVIARAGAGTISELTALGKPSVLIPFPSAAGNHQVANAQELVRGGAALMFLEEETGTVRLAGELQALLDNDKRLKEMGEKAKLLGRPRAAEAIGEIIWRLGSPQRH